MLHVVLFQPEIPPNTGNIIRLCANAGAMLHLIHPLGFELSEARVKRAGLDYHDMACVREYPDLDAFYREQWLLRMFTISTRADNCYANIKFADGDAFLFGPETRGLPQSLLESVPSDQRLRIPMRPHNRSLNLSNAVAVVLYEAWRQQEFAGGN
ncbi:MAG: tRNA (cytidine(34)-2'-O)-methyltransferase [Gammaproteobacteria bacterium]|nr:tRNA (cytidine(34)-2'-O)-methyltransferase [Gammaproteobacteria bacterium]